jgi:hypothetical protein
VDILRDGFSEKGSAEGEGFEVGFLEKRIEGFGRMIRNRFFSTRKKKHGK